MATFAKANAPSSSLSPIRRCGSHRPKAQTRRLSFSVASSQSYNKRKREVSSSKIVLPPRLCTLNSFGNDRLHNPGSFTKFVSSLAASIDHDLQSKDLEILSGRLAMIVFAAALSVEILTGNSTFHKVDMQIVCEFGGVCILSIGSAAAFAWASRAKTQVGSVFSDHYNKFVDSLIDHLVDGLFYETLEGLEEEDINPYGNK